MRRRPNGDKNRYMHPVENGSKSTEVGQTPNTLEQQVSGVSATPGSL